MGTRPGGTAPDTSRGHGPRASPVAHSDEGANDTEVAGPGTILAYSVRKPLFNDGQLPGAMVDVDNEPVPGT